MSANSGTVNGKRKIDSKSLTTVYSTGSQEDKVGFRLLRPLAKGLKLATILIVQVICAFIISQYSISHTRKGEGRLERLLDTSLSIYWNSPLKILRLPIPKSIENLSEVPIPSFIIDPSASIFLNAIMIYGSAVLLLYNIGIDDQHQDGFLLFGAVSGMLVGALASWLSWSLDVFIDYIPITITAALSLSLVWHFVRPGITIEAKNGMR